MKHLPIIHILLIFCCKSILAQGVDGSWELNGSFKTTSSSINKFYALDSLQYVLCMNENGLPKYIIYTEDGGRNWVQNEISRTVNDKSYFAAPFSMHSLVIYQLGVGGTDTLPQIIVSTDKGKTWIVRNNSDTLLENLVMWDEFNGMRTFRDTAKNQSIAAMTHDGGITFQPPIIDSVLNSFLTNENGIKSYYFFNRLSNASAIAIGKKTDVASNISTQQMPFYTSDAGQTWHQSILNDTIQKISNFANPTTNSPNITLSASPSSQRFLFSEDNGKMFEYSMPYTAKIGQIYALGAGSAWGFEAINKQKMIYTSDAGNSWKEDTLSLKGYNVQSMRFGDASRGIAIATKDKVKDTMFHVFSYKGIQKNSVEHSNKLVVINRRAFPNPASTHITLWANVSDQSLTFSGVTDIMGKTYDLPYSRIEGNFTVDVSSLPNGIYSAGAQFLNRYLFYRFIITH